MIPSSRSHRSGAALIIALVILAALMLLGLPFIFSQSGALAGTRSFAHGQSAQIGMSAAENSGIGLAGNAAARHLLEGANFGLSADQEWSRIDWDLDTTYSAGVGTTNPIRAAYADGQSYRIDWLSTPLGSATPPLDQVRRELLGLTIEDEGGKLDPNHLDAAGWQRLFAAADVGIDDPIDPADHDTFGQLAKALANLRFTLPGNRITELAQLLGALPSGTGRQHLTKAELAHLRPHLTFSTLAQARSGVIDLGTVVMVDAPPSTPTVVPYLDSVAPSKMLAFPVTPDLVGIGTVLISQAGGGANPQFSRLANGDLASNTTLSAANTVTLSPLTAGVALAIEAPPALNLHEATAATAGVLRVPALSQAPPATPLAAMGFATTGTLRGMNALADARTANGTPSVPGPTLTAFDLLNPLAAYDEICTASLLATMPGDGAMPSVDTDMTPLVVQGATTLHLANGNFGRLPTTGYARIHGNHAGGGTSTIIGPDEFISYSYTPGFAILTSITLVSLLPGAPATSASFRVEAGSPIITFIAPHEQPPVAIASPGVVTIDSSATVTDAQGKPDAKRSRRVVAQAVPQEAPLETRWVTQSQIQALLASRQGSLMTSFPNAVPRISDLATSEVAFQPGSAPAGVAEEDSTGIKPSILRSPTGSLAVISWSRTFSGRALSTDATNVWQSGFSAGPASQIPGVGTTPIPIQKLISPEGLRLGNFDRALAYPEAANGGVNAFIPFATEASYSGVTVVTPFHFSVWIKPTTTLMNAVTVFDMRMPPANAGIPLAGDAVMGITAPASTDVQGRVSLRYLTGVNQFSLIVNNGAIEHTTNHGPMVLPETFGDPFVDPQCVPDLHDPSAQPLAPAFANQTIKLRYAMGPAGLQPNVWHLLQGAIGGNLPGGMVFTVDGIVGRDATRLSPVDLSQMGDHITVPSMVLLSSLPKLDVAALGSSALTATGDIDLDACFAGNAGLDRGGQAVQDQLPTRGMIRIGQEFISYSGISVAPDRATLHHCVRARRQNTDGAGHAATDPWPVMQAHQPGDLVVPGGYRISPPNNQARQLYRGGCALVTALPDGLMPDGTTHQATYLNQTQLVLSTPPPVVVLRSTDTSVAVSQGNIVRWPDHGIVKFSATNELLAYATRTETPAGSGIFILGGLQRGRLVTPATDIVLAPGTDPTVTLVSIEVMSADPQSPASPLDAGRYETGNYAKLIQLYDPAGGRCEWLTYTDIDSVMDPAPSATHSYFVDRTNGFGYVPRDPVINPDGGHSSRGSERTAFMPNAPDFGAGTVVLPVQTEFDSGGWMIATGDVLTLAPRSASATNKPLQVCVRYAPAAGFSTVPGTVVDTHHHYFAFTTGLPDGTTWSCDPTNAHAFDMLCWPCWNTEMDLSPYPVPNTIDANLLPITQMPWAQTFQTGYALPGDGRVYLGVRDDRSYPGEQEFPGLIDQPQAGPLAGMGTMQTSTSSNAIWLSKTADISHLNGINIRYNTGTSFLQRNGLVMIGGEIFAFERNDGPPVLPDTVPGQSARLIGRSLLGSQAVDHTLYEKEVFLPIGPVTELESDLLLDTVGHVSLHDHMDAPAWLICSSDGQHMELVALPQLITAPWLRGLYGTLAQPWSSSATAGDKPLAIGWWPRYPSAFPNQAGLHALGLSADDQSSLLRCRTYPWASFPVRYHDTFFIDPDPFAIDVIAQVPASNVTMSYAAMARGLDWNFGIFKSPYDSAGAFQSSRQLFAGAPFTDSMGHALPVDGAELRVIWQYANAPYAGTDAVAFLAQAAANANQAPMLGTAKILARAPSKILAVLPP